jgi:hypothetical protein
LDSLAAPPLQPARESLCDHAPLKVTAATSVSSTRSTAEVFVPPGPPFPGGVFAGGVFAGGVFSGGALALGGMLSPPPPQETSMAATKQAPTHLMYRFIDHFLPAPCANSVIVKCA